MGSNAPFFEAPSSALFLPPPPATLVATGSHHFHLCAVGWFGRSSGAVPLAFVQRTTLPVVSECVEIATGRRFSPATWPASIERSNRVDARWQEPTYLNSILMDVIRLSSVVRLN
jgi:hypothetical protein